MTLTELKTLIQNYVENDETTFVSTLNDMIQISEQRLFELIQFDFFRKNVTGNLTVGNTYLTAPSDFQMSFSLAVIDSNTNDYHYLDKKHPSFMREYSDDAVVSLTTYTVTVASGVNTYGSGNKYYLNGINSPTIELTEGQTYRFDQSNSSNSSHPLRFSITDNGTWGEGTEYTTGVTTVGTPGSAGAYTQIIVAVDAPTLYYYCTNHTGMGGQASTPASERGRPLYYADFDKELSTGTDNGSTLIVSPVPNLNYNVELHYLYMPTSLTSSTTGTWISKNARNALLYGCLVEAYTFMKGDADLMQLYDQRFNLEVLRLKNQAEARGRKDEYRYDSLRSPVS